MMNLKSVFENGAVIPHKYTGEGSDLSPSLWWSEIPPGTKSLALICDDPDAPSRQNPAKEPWVHWLIFNIPPTTKELSEGVSQVENPIDLPGAIQGTNSWDTNNIGYRGPMPPTGSGPHRYYFRLYALDVTIDSPGTLNKSALLAGMEDHVLAEAELMGIYERKT